MLTSLYSSTQGGPVICERPFPIPQQERGVACHGSRPRSPPVTSRRARAIPGRVVSRYPLGCRQSSKRNAHRASLALGTHVAPNHRGQLGLHVYERWQSHTRTDDRIHRAGRQDQVEASRRTPFQGQLKRDLRTFGANLREGRALTCVTKIFILLAGIWVPMIWATLDMTLNWPPLERYYFSQYFLTAGASGKGQHFFLYVLDSKGARRARNEDVLRGPLRGDPSQGGFPFLLSEQAQRRGAWGLAWREFPDLENRTAYEWLRQEIYDGQTPLELIRWPLLFGCAFIFGLLPLAIHRDRKAAQEAKRGQILRGPRLVSAAEFNRLRQSDGIGFETLRWPGNRHPIIGRQPASGTCCEFPGARRIPICS